MFGPADVDREMNRIELLASWIHERLNGGGDEVENALEEIQVLAEPEDDVTYVKLHGIAPDDIPYEGGEYDEAQTLANHIYDYIHEDLSFDVDGVATHVNPDLQVIEVPVEPTGED